MTTNENELSPKDKFKAALNESRVNMIDALNENQNHLYDIFFKVIGIPNIIIILAASNQHTRELIQQVFYLKCAYLLTIYSYLAALFFYISSFFLGNHEFKKKIGKADKYSKKLQLIINQGTELDEVFQNKMNGLIESTHHFHKLVPLIKNIIGFVYVVNVISFIVFIVILINNLV